ncbi:unnamed protein product [Pleuronectes platessa]|uniref:Uncharacterized protein n=1 Tax=Pleuronectes platessa TaxID=8262 RepID=A0A9N7U226_PLEPL|nr:unnamed protein product [Pleuronectes platessa]
MIQLKQQYEACFRAENVPSFHFFITLHRAAVSVNGKRSVAEEYRTPRGAMWLCWFDPHLLRILHSSTRGHLIELKSHFSCLEGRCLEVLDHLIGSSPRPS